jgi:hypothetical protein
MPDRLMAGLQILVLTMLVRIQLGQQENPSAQLEGFLFSDELQAYLRSSKKTKIMFSQKGKGLLIITPFMTSEDNPVQHRPPGLAI